MTKQFVSLLLLLVALPARTTVAAQTQPPLPLPMAAPPPAETNQQVMERLLALPKLDAQATIAALERTHTPLSSVLYAIGDAAGIRLEYDSPVNLGTFVDIKLSNVTAEDALHRALDANGLAFTVLGPKSVVIYSDSPEGRVKWVQSIRTFTIVNGDPQAIAAILNRTMVTVEKTPLGRERPVIVPNSSARTISARATADTMAEIARLIAANDKNR